MNEQNNISGRPRRQQRAEKSGYRNGAKAIALLIALFMSLSMTVYPSGVLAAPAPAVTESATADTGLSEKSGPSQSEESKVTATAADTTLPEPGTAKTTAQKSASATTETQTPEEANSFKTRWPEIEQVKARAYVVVDGSNMEILAEHNARARMPMASTTKILTALTVINHPDFDPERIVTVSKEATVLPSSSASRVGLKTGEKLTTEECLYGLMVHSGNDCANVLAENYSQARVSDPLERRAAFCAEATKYAHSLGANDTSIKNPSGFTEENHFSTAYDLALLANEGMKEPLFRSLVSTAFYRMPATNKHPVAGWKILRNTNSLVLSSPELYGSQYFQSYDGVKTGTTSLAGKCLVGAGTTHDDRQIIATLLNTELAVEGANLTIDIFMRALLEEGAARLGVEPIRKDYGTSGQGYIAGPVTPAQENPEQTVDETEITEETAEESQATESVQTLPAETGAATVEQNGNQKNTGIFSGDLTNMGLITLGVLMLVLVVILLILGLSIRKDKNRGHSIREDKGKPVPQQPPKRQERAKSAAAPKGLAQTEPDDDSQEQVADESED